MIPMAESPVIQGKFRNRMSQHIIVFSLDPHEDPVSGLERVSSNLQIRQRERARRARLEQDTHTRHRSPVAADHALSGNYESLDYEIVENEIYRAQEATKDYQVTFNILN
jgi:hypothetical protein